jgi:hypothetical protein
MKGIIQLKRKKGNILLGEVGLKLLIGLVCLVLLIFLLVRVSGSIRGHQLERLAKAELDNIIQGLKQAEKTEKEIPFVTASIKDWILITSEFGEFCKGKFCLCLCKDLKCEKEHVCQKTEKFVVLRESQNDRKNLEVRYIRLDLAENLKIKYENIKVYPFNSGKNFEETFIFLIERITPLFFKYESGWKWSPDLKNWMKLSEKKVSSGNWADQELSYKNRVANEFLLDLESKKSNEEAENLFKIFRVYESEGVYIISK